MMVTKGKQLVSESITTVRGLLSWIKAVRDYFESDCFFNKVLPDEVAAEDRSALPFVKRGAAIARNLGLDSVLDLFERDMPSAHSVRQADRLFERGIELIESPGKTLPSGSASMPGGFCGGTDLADGLGIPESRRDAFFSQLGRKRKFLGDENWLEVRDRRPNTPRYLYRSDSPKLRDLAAAYKTPKPA